MPKLLLRADVTALGRIGDLVDVSAGYARNYLVPQGLAVAPTPANIKVVEQAKKEADARRIEELKEKKRYAEKLDGVEVTIVSRANEQGHLFGSVGPKEIADALKEEGYNVHQDHIHLDEHIKQVDKYTVPVRFGEDIEANVTVWVAPEKIDEDQADDPEPDYDDPTSFEANDDYDGE